jgi:hypothetical protein
MASPERILLGFYAVAVLLLFLAKCGVNNVADGGTETGNARVTGILYESDGKTPAAQVNVSIRPRGTLADIPGPAKRLADTASVTTDDSGRFVFDSTLDTGTYVIEATDGNNAALVDSVHVIDTDSTVEVSDTLKPAGGITGTIHLSEGGDARKVFVLAFGINRFTVPDTDGAFTFDSLAEAAYDLRIISTLDDYDVLDTVGIPVVSEEVTDLDTLRLEFTGIPAVKGLTLSYDTLKQIVTLRWERADTALVSGYNVYRQHVDSGLVKINSFLVTDTVYSDSTVRQDEMYTYQVKALDKSGNEGVLSVSVGIAAVSPFTFAMAFAPLGSDDGEVLGPLGLTLDQHGRVFVVDGGNSRIEKFDSTGKFLMKFGGYGSADSQFIGPVDLAIDSAGNIYVVDEMRVKKFDSTGAFNTSWATKGNAMAIAISSEQHIYVSTSHEKSFVQVFTESGDSVAEWTLPDGGKGIGITDDGRIIVSTIDATIGIYSSDGMLLDNWLFSDARQGCRFFPIDNLLYATIGYELDYVAVVDLSGNLVARFGSGGSYALAYPKDVIVLDDGILVSDNNGIQLYMRP